VTRLPAVPKDVLSICYDEDYLNKHQEYIATCELVWHHDAEIIRRSIQDELQAQSDYESRADDVVHPLARKVLLDVANEEKVHQYEFLEVLRQIDRFQNMAENRAKKEIREMD